jgi:hypothetical protein
MSNRAEDKKNGELRSSDSLPRKDFGSFPTSLVLIGPDTNSENTGLVTYSGFSKCPL